MPLLPNAPPLIRLTPAHYADGAGAIARLDDAAEIAARLFDQEGDMPDPFGLSSLMVDWGQFLDHDLDLTRDASGEFLQVPGLVGPFQRSVYQPGSGASAEAPRAPVNEITAAIDGSMLYGSTELREAALRSFEGGRLRTLETETGPLMPIAGEGEVMGGAEATDSPVFFAGDLRANENLGLTLLHTLFLREHNHWADRLAAAHPTWDDQTLFQTARAIVEHELQAITYRDWLPLLLGGYDATAAEAAAAQRLIEAAAGQGGEISVEFSTAAFRFGHTMVSSQVPVLTEAGSPAPDLALTIEEVVFNPAPLLAGYFDHLLRGQAAIPAQALDGKLIDDLNFFLRAPDGVTGFSLAALNILRGRDHGLGPYLEVRAALLGDIDPATIDPADFSVISSDPAVQADLAAVYDSVQAVDLWVGGLVEDKPAGAQLGPLFAYILTEQFARTRAADAGFLTLPEGLDEALIAEIEATGLHDIMLRNSDLDQLQENPFLAATRLGGSDTAEALMGSATADLIFGLAGDDSLMGGAGDDALSGGAGQDQASYGGARDHYAIALHADGTVTVTDRREGGDGKDRLEEIEHLSFADGNWALSRFVAAVTCTEAELRSLVELYLATFGRAPDGEGLCFWAGVLAGGTGLEEIAALFADQPETRALYPDPMDSAALVKAVYQNLLDRDPDAEGGAFWQGHLESGALTPENFFLTFLEGIRSTSPDWTSDQALQQAADLARLVDKVDLGLSYAAIKGLNDQAAARTVVEAYDGTSESMLAARAFMEEAYESAQEAEAGDFLVSLVGIVEDPFLM